MQIETRPLMTKFRAALLAGVCCAGVAGFALGTSALSPVTPSFAEAVKVEAPAVFSFADVVESVSPAVVSVRVETKIEPAANQRGFNGEAPGRRFFEEFFGQRPGGQYRNRPRGPQFGHSQGSGFFVSEDGYLVTNNHVIENGSSFSVVMSDGSELDAKLIGTDPKTDLAVLKVDEDRTFTYVEFDQQRPRAGEWVVAVGNPFGLGGTVTAGIVSAHGRNIGATRYDDFIQIDAAVNKGNSGGPAFNLSGQVIGVNTAIFSPSGGNVGIAFAIPAALAEEIVADLIDDGNVTRGWLGVQIQPVTPEIAEAVGLESDDGTIIAGVEQDSPAEKSGIESGDIITEINGKSIKGPRQLSREIASLEPESEIDMKVWRDGEEQNLTVKLGALEETQAQAPSAEKPSRMARLGVQLEPSQDGLTILDVEPGSVAAEQGLRPGDVIASVNGEKVTNLRDLRAQLKAAREAGRNSALLQLKREERTVFAPIPTRKG